MNNVYNEEESKRARIFQREKRQELQLIIERCNQIQFEYVKVPSERTDNYVFGSSKPRRIYFFTEDKTVNSFMRRCFKEEFPERQEYITKEKKLTDDQTKTEIEIRPNAIFASKVPRFQENLLVLDSQVYRRKKKVQETQSVPKVNTAPFGSSCPKKLMVTRDIKITEVPMCSFIPRDSYKKCENIQYSFGGKVSFLKTYDIVCSPKILDSKCNECEGEPKNIYWKNIKTHAVLCRPCYNIKLFEIKNKSRGIVERHKKLEIFQHDFRKKRHCSFFHQHSGTKAAISILSKKDFSRQRKKENFLNTFMKY